MRALLVDGYNLIYHHPALQGLLRKNLVDAREGLLRELAPLLSPDAYDLVMVVFDAARSGGADPAWEERGGMAVVFTRRRQTADSFIEAAARRMSAQGEEVVVATHDRLLRGVVEGFGAKGMDGETLFSSAREARERTREEMEKIAGPRRRLEDRLSDEIRGLLDRMRYGQP